MNAIKNKIEQKEIEKMEPEAHMPGDVSDAIRRFHDMTNQASTLEKSLETYCKRSEEYAKAYAGIDILPLEGKLFSSKTQKALSDMRENDTTSKELKELAGLAEKHRVKLSDAVKQFTKVSGQVKELDKMSKKVALMKQKNEENASLEDSFKHIRCSHQCFC